ncbi:hypothetical protein [Cryobacterium aureum]|uniref:hypothetical protein n=1 Tax=Cryobacterium aureum TaxID=995037 RepID=UPI000CF460D4|nr:hypothetical protein [Cryobacterium aureum]
MKESISQLHGHTLRLAIFGPGAAIVWAALTLLLGTLSPASADTEDAPPTLLTTAASTLLPAAIDPTPATRPAPAPVVDVPRGRSADRTTAGVLALSGVAVLPSTPTFDPGSTPD